MKELFRPIQLADRPLTWDYQYRTEGRFQGYYHWHNCCEILYVHEGSGTIFVNQGLYRIRPGMLFFFQPFQLHHVHADSSPEQPYVRTLLHFDQAVVADLLRPYPRLQAFFIRMWQGNVNANAIDLSEAEGYVRHVILSYERAVRNGRGGKQEEVALLFVRLLTSLLEVEEECIRASVTEVARPLRYAEAAMEWIEAHYAEEVRLEQLAEALHLSKFYLSRVFREETGSSITDYLTARRIKQACRLLQTTLFPVERVGMEVGLPNTSYFVRLFKRIVGVTPLKYRKGG